MERREERRRQRARMACEPCRERKRKCGGGQPCQLCINFGYEAQCHYRSTPRRRRGTVAKATPNSQGTSGEVDRVQSTTPGDQPTDVSDASGKEGLFAKSLESNSGSAFVRKFAMAVDPSRAPSSTMLGWNIFLGERYVPSLQPVGGITDVLTFQDMQDLAGVYFVKVDPCYGFIDRQRAEQAILLRWSSQASIAYDAVLCGIAALGCLFSTLKDLQTESCLVDLTKSLLNLAGANAPSLDSATAWVLHTVYLRMAANLDEAWMASCTALHIIDAAGLHYEPDSGIHLHHPGTEVNPEIRRRVYGVARHLNTWLSFDLGRSRVILQNVSSIPPAPREGEYTTELIALLPYSDHLDPAKTPSSAQLLSAFSDVMNRTHTGPPSILAQVNLMLCFYRRLYTLKTKIPDELLSKACRLIDRGIASARALNEAGSPWHHVANVPFQCVCTLLAIDTVQSFSLLADATACLEAVTRRWQTRATQDVAACAHMLIHIHRKRREAEAKKQAELLQLYPQEQSAAPAINGFDFDQAFDEIPWFNELIPDVDYGVFENFLDP